MKYIKILLVLCGVFVQSINTGIVPSTENSNALQVPQEIIKTARKAATLVKFVGVYEVAVPKKGTIQIDPWSKFMARGINLQTKNSMIIFNPSWFLDIPQDQQLFLLGYCFMAFKEGSIPFSMKIIPFIVSFVYYFLLFCIAYLFDLFFMVWLLGKTPLHLLRKKKAKKFMGISLEMLVRVAMVWGIVSLSSSFLIDNVYSKLTDYVARKHEIHLMNMVVQKTGNKDAAIKALRYFSASVKEAIKNGETFFAPHANRFENYANALEDLQ